MSWEDLEKKIAENDNYTDNYNPIWWAYIWGISFFIVRQCELRLEAVETYPYRMDGEIPMVFIQVLWLEICVEWKWLYKLTYKRQNGYLPAYLDKDYMS